MEDYRASNEMIAKMLSCLRACADLVGAPDARKADAYGFTPGLNMENSARTLDGMVEKLREGIFQVLFTGCFSCGKSTLLNALMRRELLKTSIKAETAVITQIIFEKDEKVIVHKREMAGDGSGRNAVEEMSVEAFFERYRVNQDEPDQFKDIDYVVLQQPQSGIAGSAVQLVDSPGTNNSDEDTEAARAFARSASAIVYMINATTPFVQDDKTYIQTHYTNRHMKNLFFVINRVDCVTEEEFVTLQQSAREQLRCVFTDEAGQFDEMLFSRRVFYTNAYGSLKSRLHQPIRVMGQSIMIDDKGTGVLRFERALASFLTDGNRDRDALMAYMPRLAGMYLAGERKAEETLKKFGMGRAQLEKARETAQAESRDIEDIIRGVSSLCNSAVKSIVASARNEYLSAVNRIDANWDAHFQAEKIPFNMGDMLKMIWQMSMKKLTHNDAKRDARMNEIMAPIADAVKAYVSAEMQTLGENLSGALQAHLTELQEQLGMYQRRLESLDTPLDLSGIAPENANLEDLRVGASDRRDVNLFQIFLGLVGADPEMILEGGRGKTGNVQALVKFLTKNILEFLALYVVYWPIGIAMLIKRVYDMVSGAKLNKNSTVQDMLSNMRESTAAELRKRCDEYVMSVENKTGGAILRAGGAMSGGIQTSLDSYRAELTRILNDMQQNANAEEAERRRAGQTLEALNETISRMYECLTGEPMRRETMAQIAVMEL